MRAASGLATEYLSNVQQTLYLFVMRLVYLDNTFLRYNYGIFRRYKFTLQYRYLLFVKKKLSCKPRIYLKYNVRKGTVGRSVAVPWTFECLVGRGIIQRKKITTAIFAAKQKVFHFGMYIWYTYGQLCNTLIYNQSILFIWSGSSNLYEHSKIVCYDYVLCLEMYYL